MARTTLSTLRWRVFNAADELCGATVHVEDAAVLVAGLDEGATIRADGVVLWTEGEDGSAEQDDVPGLVYKRLVGEA
jgi:hypothetical protein